MRHADKAPGRTGYPDRRGRGLLRKQIAAHLETLGAEVTGVGALHAARQALGESCFDFALLDVNLPDGCGTTLLTEKAFSPHTGVIVMTADGGVSGAVEAMSLGALDYLVKPFDVEELPLVIARARHARQAARLEEHWRGAQVGGMLFFGPSLAAVQQRLEKILTADRRIQDHLPPVLIEGETGTGKTSIARWLHHHGARRQGTGRRVGLQPPTLHPHAPALSSRWPQRLDARCPASRTTAPTRSWPNCRSDHPEPSHQRHRLEPPA